MALSPHRQRAGPAAAGLRREELPKGEMSLPLSSARPFVGAVWIVAILFAFSDVPATGAATCGNSQIHVQLLKFVRKTPASWVASFKIMDDCPDTDTGERVRIHFTYKEQHPDGTVQSVQSVYVETIHPNRIHAARAEIPIFARDEITDVIIDSFDMS
jgi:hypothetical protein